MTSRIHQSSVFHYNHFQSKILNSPDANFLQFPKKIKPRRINQEESDPLQINDTQVQTTHTSP